jgi:GPH family glycoside/pentoside/hexuronide:cation symporter
LVARFGKKETASAGMLVAGIVYTLLYFLPDLTFISFIAISAVGMFGYAFFNLVVWAFVTDVIDYHEYLTGLKEEGTVYSVYSFSRKVGQALAGGIGGFALTVAGYNSTLKVQTQGALDGIHTIATLVPGIIFLIVCMILVFLYPLTKQRSLQLTTDLASKRKSMIESIESGQETK